MARICPTVMPLSDDMHVFRAMMERVGLLTTRLQIDLMDGEFAPHRNTQPAQLWWPDGVQADLHVMYTHPETILDTLLGLRPHMILFHAEAKTDVLPLLRRSAEHGVRAGVVLLRETTVASTHELVEHADHVLLFGGTLGEAGHADLSVLSKVPEIRALNRRVEIGWDGGANMETIPRIATAGVDIINVGAALQRAENPAEAYRQLSELAA